MGHDVVSNGDRIKALQLRCGYDVGCGMQSPAFTYQAELVAGNTD